MAREPVAGRDHGKDECLGALTASQPDLAPAVVGQTAPIKWHHKHRFEVIKEYSGCVCCLLMGYKDVHASIEHVTERGRRKGKGSEQHDWTIGLDKWHHFGHCWSGQNRQKMIGMVGPSLAHGRKYFEEYFGPEEILVKIQDLILTRYDAKPWEPYNMPTELVRMAREYWISLNREQSCARGTP